MGLPPAGWKEELLAHHESIYLICLGFTRNPTVAEDLCQDVYLKAWGKLSTIRNGSALKSWIIRIAHNICLDFLRRTPPIQLSELERHRPDFQLRDESGPDNPDDDLDKKISRINTAVGLLPRKLREAFVLREYGHLSYEDMARTLRIREGTVMSRLYRARRAVVNLFEEKSHDSGR